jgi:cell division protein FtsQ
MKRFFSRQNANIKAPRMAISIRRRLGLYYVRFALFAKLMLVIFLLLLIFTSVFSGVKDYFSQAWYQFTAKQGFELENVIIQGQVNAPTSDILRAIDAMKGTPLFALNLEEIKKGLDSSSWIKASVVERRLPNSLYIAINERNPVAIWQSNNKLYLIDEEGERISGKDIAKFPDLILVVGDEANIYAKSLLDDLSASPDLMQKIISAVRYGNRRWDLNFEDDDLSDSDSALESKENEVFNVAENIADKISKKRQINVKMPEGDFATAYQYIETLHKNNKFFGSNIKTLDLRNNDKYYMEKQ